MTFNYNFQVQEFQLQQKTLFSLLFQIYDNESVTSYIHSFVYHLHELKDLHGNINLLNLEGLEKKNHLLSVQYFRATNKQLNQNKSDYLMQLLFQQNRIDLLSYLTEHFHKYY